MEKNKSRTLDRQLQAIDIIKNNYRLSTVKKTTATNTNKILNNQAYIFPTSHIIH